MKPKLLDSFDIDLITKEGMSEFFGGIGPDVVNGGSKCNVINNGNECDVINNSTSDNCSLINQANNCSLINNDVSCLKTQLPPETPPQTLG